MTNFYKKGISAAEIIVVIAVLSILAAVVIPQFSKIREREVLKSAVADILSSINKAKVETLASVNSSSYGVHFQSDKVVIFKGVSFSSGDANNETVDLTLPANISNVTLSGVSATSGDIYFNRLSGAPSKSGTISVSTPNYSKIVTISALGSTSVN
jgi:Tfp pilus assembly protein FimT